MILEGRTDETGPVKLKESLYVNKNKMMKVLRNTPLLFSFCCFFAGGNGFESTWLFAGSDLQFSS